jgi:ABC-type antimicrobial peptide transport system permease subunit
MLFDIISKSVLLVFIASYISKRTKKISLLLLTLVVLSYQLAGGLGQWLITGSFQHSYNSIIIGTPGMALQVLFGFVILIAMKDYEFKNDR